MAGVHSSTSLGYFFYATLQAFLSVHRVCMLLDILRGEKSTLDLRHGVETGFRSWTGAKKMHALHQGDLQRLLTSVWSGHIGVSLARGAWTDYKTGYASIPALAGLALHHAVGLGLNLRIGSTFQNANRHSYSITYVERYVSRVSDKQKHLKSPAHAQKKPVTHVECHTKMPQRSVGMYPGCDVTPISAWNWCASHTFTLSEPVYRRATYILRIQSLVIFVLCPFSRYAMNFLPML